MPLLPVESQLLTVIGLIHLRPEQALVVIVYCVFYAPRDAWGGWTSAAFYDLGPNLNLGISAALHSMSAWWAWDLMSLASSYLGVSAFAANQVIGALMELPF